MLELMMAGILSASGAWMINRLILRNFSLKMAIIWLIPLIEELLKTGLAFLMTTSILGVHLIFGILEGIIDWRNHHGKMRASFLSVATHMIFGLIAMKVAISLDILSAITASTAIHMAWNHHIYRKAF